MRRSVLLVLSQLILPHCYATPLLEDCALLDLTHVLQENMTQFPTSTPYKLTIVKRGHTDAGYYYETNDIATTEHVGTHVDAPSHFSKDGLRLHEIPLTSLIGEACVIDVTVKANNFDYEIRIQDVLDWEILHGPLDARCIALFRTGFERYWQSKVKYLGTNRNNRRMLHFPGVHPDLASWLTKERSVKAVGIDTASIDFGQSQHYESHQILGAAGIPVLENLRRLVDLPARGATLIALPMNIKEGSGAPVRVMAYGWHGATDPCRRNNAVDSCISTLILLSSLVLSIIRSNFLC